MSKVCTIVGVGPGVGLAVARRFGREGFKLALVARNSEALQGYAAELQQQIGADVQISTYAADVANFSALVETFDKIKAEVGDSDVLVYNAALLQQDKFSSLTPEQLQRAFEVNVSGALVAAQQVLPAQRAKKSGTLLFTGGGLAFAPQPNLASLSLGKAALRSLVYALAAEVEPEGIHVATVTISGYVQPGTFFDPDKIAEAYWTLYNQPAGAFEREIVFKEN